VFAFFLELADLNFVAVVLVFLKVAECETYIAVFHDVLLS